MTQPFLTQLRERVAHEGVTPHKVSTFQQAASFKLTVYFTGEHPPMTFFPAGRDEAAQIHNMILALEAEYGFQHNPAHDEVKRSWWVT